MKKFLHTLAIGAASALVFASCNSTTSAPTQSQENAQASVTILPRLNSTQAFAPVGVVAVSMIIDGKDTLRDSALFNNGKLTFPKVPKGKSFTLAIAGYNYPRVEGQWVWAADTVGNTGSLKDSSIVVVDLTPKAAPAAPSQTNAASQPALITGNSFNVKLATPAAGQTIWYTTDGSVPTPTNGSWFNPEVNPFVTVNRPADTTKPVKLVAVAYQNIPGLGNWAGSSTTISLKFGGSTVSNVAQDTSLKTISINGASIPFTGTTILVDSLPVGSTSATFSAVPTATSASVSYTPNGTVLLVNDSARATILVENGTSSQIYTLRFQAKRKPVIVPTSSDTTLSNLTITTTPAVLSMVPATFSKSVQTYTVTLDPTVTSATVVGTASANAALVSYATVGATTKPSTGTIALSTDSTLSVTVANGGKELVYTINFRHKATTPIGVAHDSTLKSLTINGKAITIKNTIIADTVENAVTSAEFVAVPSDVTDTLIYSKDNLIWTKTVSTLTLKEGMNYYYIKVRNTNGNSLAYTIGVFRKGTAVIPAHDTALTGLTTDRATLTPDFDAATLAYTNTIDDTVTMVTLAATAKDPLATVTYNGAISGKINVSSYTAGQTRNVNVKVLNGESSLTYTVAITKKKSGGGGTDPGTGTALDLSGTSTFVLEQGTSYTVTNSCSNNGAIAFTKVWDAADQGAINVTVDGTAVTGSYYASSSAGATFTLISTLGGTTLKCQ
ncbi:MAG: hypothetical protein RL318_2285 [Fibrobacterota bacterium]|jgi:hypothetical protein